MIDRFEVGLKRYPVGSSDAKWFPLWIRRYARFCGLDPQSTLPVSRDRAIDFSRELLKRRIPAWQRLQAVRSLIAYRKLLHDQDSEDLRDVVIKLGDLAAVEANEQDTQAVRGDSEAAESRSKTEPRSTRKPRRKSFAAKRPPAKEPKLVTEMRLTLRRQRYKYDTEKAYVGWVARFLAANGTETADHLDETHIRDFLTELVVGDDLRRDRECDVDWDREDYGGQAASLRSGGVAQSTQNQAKSALLFLFQKHLGRELGFIDAAPADVPPRLPVVLDRQEIVDMIARGEGKRGWFAGSEPAGGFVRGNCSAISRLATARQMTPPRSSRRGDTPRRRLPLRLPVNVTTATTRNLSQPEQFHWHETAR
jgi:hypothetical protein